MEHADVIARCDAPSEARGSAVADDRAAEVARELVRRRADLVDHGRTSLERHLSGVYAVLSCWAQPERVRLAGLLHSAYSTEDYGYRLFGHAERPRVRELVGVDAERLVFAFCGCKRDALLSAASAARTPARAGPVTLATRWDGVTVRVERRDLAELMVLHAANLVEQVSLPKGGPAPCLATASALLAAAREGAEIAPPVFDGGATAMMPEQETELLRAYRASLAVSRGCGSAHERDVLSSSPVGEPLVLAGLRALADGRADETAAFAQRALHAFDAWGVAWDKRLRLRRWRQLAELLARGGRARDRELGAAARRAGAALEAARGSPARLWALLDARASFDERAAPGAPSPAAAAAAATAQRTNPAAPGPDAWPPLPPRFARYLAGLRTNAERPMLPFYPGLRAEPWHDPREFPVVADLERLAPDIAAEAKAFDTDRFQDEAEDIGRTGRWGVLFLLETGRRNEDILARCPSLRWLLEHHQTLTTHAGLMYFSCLDPRSRVAPHRGPTNVRVRCHLGLEVPDACGVRVGGVSRTWQEGRCIVFDDSFNHEVWNDSDRRRVVLVLDLWHPDLLSDEIALLAGLHRYGAASGTSAAKYWARNDAARRRAQAPAPARTATPGTPATPATPAPRDPHGDPSALNELVSAALRAGELDVAGERAAEYAQVCRGSRWYPVRRDRDPELPASVPWERVVTPSKLIHDLEQLEYLKEHGLVGDDLAAVVHRYHTLLDTLRPLGDAARVPLVGAARDEIGSVYSRLLHVRPTPRVPQALSGQWDGAAAEDRYSASHPNVVVVDDFLSVDALESLRLFCLESTIWSTNRYDHGRLGSFFREGFNCPLLIQIAKELREALPRLIGRRHPMTQLWGYKYASSQPELPPHADFAAVNVNFWITPDEANLDEDSGGLVIYDVAAPEDWDFPTYNRNPERIRALLSARAGRATRIPYRCNRAVIFDSDLFHATEAVSFRSGYENRRINATVLFGNRTSRA